MDHFAAELVDEGFEVGHRRAPNLEAGVQADRDDDGVAEVVAMEFASWDGRELLTSGGLG